jgi:hypothetical protein
MEETPERRPAPVPGMETPRAKGCVNTTGGGRLSRDRGGSVTVVPRLPRLDLIWNSGFPLRADS